MIRPAHLGRHEVGVVEIPLPAKPACDPLPFRHGLIPDYVPPKPQACGIEPLD